MPIYYLLGIVIIGLGLRMGFKGYAAKSKPRVVNGLAVVPVGAAQFFRANYWLATALIVLGVILFVWSLFLLKREPRSHRSRWLD